MCNKSYSVFRVPCRNCSNNWLSGRLFLSTSPSLTNSRLRLIHTNVISYRERGIFMNFNVYLWTLFSHATMLITKLNNLFLFSSVHTWPLFKWWHLLFGSRSASVHMSTSIYRPLMSNRWVDWHKVGPTIMTKVVSFCLAIPVGSICGYSSGFFASLNEQSLTNVISYQFIQPLLGICGSQVGQWLVFVTLFWCFLNE